VPPREQPAQPSLSPDGSQVAFTWTGANEDNFDIYLKLLGPGEPVRLTTSPQRDYCPTWSPDGKQIAFLRFVNRQRAMLFVMTALGRGMERKLADLELPMIKRLGPVVGARRSAYRGRHSVPRRRALGHLARTCRRRLAREIDHCQRRAAVRFGAGVLT
jgi:Tol biopolymer transport system component